MKRVLSLGAVALLLLLLWVGWPTPYRYDHWRYDGDDYPVRISRLTGGVEILTARGWHTLRPRPAPPTVRPVPASLDTGMRTGTTR